MFMAIMTKSINKDYKDNVRRRIIAAVMMFSYIVVISPVTLFAEAAEKAVKAVEAAALREEKAEVLISAMNGGKVTLGDASIEIPEGALKKDTKNFCWVNFYNMFKWRHGKLNDKFPVKIICQYSLDEKNYTEEIDYIVECKEAYPSRLYRVFF